MILRKFNNYDLDGMPPVLAWNPLAMRCCPVDEGCAHCWHLRMADRLANNPMLTPEARESYAGSDPVLLDSKKGLHPVFIPVKKQSVIAVQFMGDLWHPNIGKFCRQLVFNIMFANPEHVYLLLTKRPERVTETLPDNCWLGTSVHDQASAERRIPELLKAKAAHKWLSVEPMLGDVCRPLLHDALAQVKFVACGPETGAGARPCNTEWIRYLANYCEGDGIPFYDKREPSAEGFTRREWTQEWTNRMGRGRSCD